LPASVALNAGVDTGEVGGAASAAGAGLPSVAPPGAEEGAGAGAGVVVACAHAGALPRSSHAIVKAAAKVTVLFIERFPPFWFSIIEIAGPLKQVPCH